MIATDIEQSKHLLELGLDLKTADMFYFSYGMFRPMKLHVGKILEDVVTGKRQWAIPAWSLDALLEIMRKLNATVTLQITGNSTFLRIKDNSFMWQKDIHVENPMDAVYGCMLWLFEQGLIKKGDNDESKD